MSLQTVCLISATRNPRLAADQLCASRRFRSDSRPSQAGVLRLLFMGCSAAGRTANDICASADVRVAPRAASWRPGAGGERATSIAPAWRS